MKKLSIFSCVVLFFGFAGVANAALYDRGGGLIYDDVLEITWLQNASYGGGTMTYDNAVTWADGLEYYDSVRGVTWDDWRLPQTLPVNGATYNTAWKADGSSDVGYNMSSPDFASPYSTASEMAYMYYVNLGNLGRWIPDGAGGNEEQTGWGLNNTSPFTNLLSNYYWSGTADTATNAWVFYFYDGNQIWANKVSGSSGLPFEFSAWAVRPGDVPIPTTMLLLGSGLVGLGILRQRFKKS